jgi:hypothetical protein
MPITPPVLGKVTYEPITIFRTTTGGTGMPQMERFPESATQTFQQGVPLKYSAGYLVEADGTWAAADIIAGMSVEPGHNLTTSGVAQGGVSEGTARNQASSKIIPVGAWVRDGKCGLYVANGENIFSAFATNGPFTQSMIAPGTYYQLLKDSTSGFWYVNLTGTTGNGAIVELLGVDPASPNTTTDGIRVFFRIKGAQRQFD